MADESILPSTDEWMKLMQTREDLNPELADYIEESSFGRTLKHPLVFSLFYHEGLNAMLNKQFEQKQKHIEEALEKQQWTQYIWLHERPYRMQQFVEICHDMSDEDYWSILGSIWSDSENLWQYGKVPGMLLRSNRPGRSEHMMESDEREMLAKLPDRFVVYRGHQMVNRLGYSWSLSYWKAKWFAQRFDAEQNGVLSAMIDKEKVYALLLGRNEFEIVTDPKYVVEAQPVRKLRRLAWVERVYQEALGLRSGGIHGVWHWNKVEHNAMKLCHLNRKADQTVARLFAILHDTQRVNDDHDPDHGRRAAKYAEALYERGMLKVNKGQLTMLMDACCHHNEGHTTDNPTLGVCWDADRLDLTRVGIIPDPKYFSTDAGRELMWRI